ncbi:MAG: sensor histidine kinase, partial [Treponema sp.]|nr:sensor histidine kinase [Treponema sp.]
MMNALSCAARDNSQSAGILGIVAQWAIVERRLAAGEMENHTLEAIDTFRQSIQSYLTSEMYRIYRLAPISPNTTFGPSEPNEMPGIQDAAGLALSLREAVLNGDREKAMLISADISGNLMQAMMQDAQAEQFAGGAYVRLLVVFIVFLALTAFVIWLLYKALTRSLRREAEGSDFTRATLLAQEKERSRLSRELHDTIAQDLRYLSLEMNKIGKTEDKPEREKRCAEAALRQTDLIRKVRDICDYLIPPDFRFQGLPDALRRLCLDFGKRIGINCRIDIMENIQIDFLDEEKQLQIFRIVQEALTNVEKHAQAAEAIVILRCDPDGNISIGISDDGRGFDRAYSDLSLGIRGMNERAALLGGSLEITSERGEGTLVRLQVPAQKGIQDES